MCVISMHRCQPWPGLQHHGVLGLEVRLLRKQGSEYQLGPPYNLEENRTPYQDFNGSKRAWKKRSCFGS